MIFYAICAGGGRAGEGAIWLYATRPRLGLADPSAAAGQAALLAADRAGARRVPGVDSGGCRARRRVAPYMWILIFISGLADQSLHARSLTAPERIGEQIRSKCRTANDHGRTGNGVRRISPESTVPRTPPGGCGTARRRRCTGPCRSHLLRRTAAQPVDRRTDLIKAAQAHWASALTDLGGRNTLLYFKDRRSGTLDLAAG